MNANAVSDDPVLMNDWHPVAASASVAGAAVVHALLMGRELALWRDAEGLAHAWEDRCPHRGTRFSIGRVEQGELVCAYHGWRFGAAGRCSRIPALPELEPPAAASAHTYGLRERYGLVWVCLGDPAAEVPPFPEHADERLTKVLCGPYDVATGGPRIIENFLDMAHFPFVHTGILGDAARTRVRDCQVQAWDDGAGGTGIMATGCFFWQPQPNSFAQGGSEVEYTYRVVRPLTAILTKLPQAAQGIREAISLHVQPLTEESSRAWMICALTNRGQTEEALRAFQDRIFLQDKPVLENQVPKRLPLAAGAEVPMASDHLSQAYRRRLKTLGLRYGVTQ